MRRSLWILAALLVAASGACGKKADESGGQAANVGTEPGGGSWTGEGEKGPATPQTAADPGAGSTTPSGTAVQGAATETPPATGTAETPPATGTTETPAEVLPPRLAFAKGKVQAIDGEGTHELTEGASILPGTVVIVEPEGQAEIDLPDGSVVDLDEMTELLIRDASVEGKARSIDLAVLAGSIRIHAAPNDDPDSSFFVATPTGTTEVQGTEYAVQVSPADRSTHVVVYDGRVQVGAGEAKQVVTPAVVGTPVAVRITPATQIEPIEVEPVVVDQWDDWTDRQADDLITRYDIDIQAPEQIAAPVLIVEQQPFWRPQIEIRRGRIVRRAHVLVTAVGPEKLVVLPTPRARFELALRAWAPVVLVPRQERIAVARRVRLEAWNGTVEVRTAARVALVPTIVELRGAWVDHKGKVHGRGRGHGGAVVVLPGVPAPTVVVGGPAVAITPPSVSVTVPGVSVSVPGVSVGVGGAVHVGGPGVTVVGPGHHHPPGPTVVVPGGPPGPTVVVPGGPPGPTVVVPGGRPHGGGHGRGH